MGQHKAYLSIGRETAMSPTHTTLKYVREQHFVELKLYWVKSLFDNKQIYKFHSYSSDLKGKSFLCDIFIWKKSLKKISCEKNWKKITCKC